MKRSGLITKKVGMTRMFAEDGRSVPVTVLESKDCRVIAHRTMDKEGYTALQIGLGEAKEKHISKPVLGHFAKQGVKPLRKVLEFRVSEDCLIPVGQQISVNHFVAGQFVDACGTSKGKGFAGAMKRWNFSGLEAAHGVMKAHRSLGSTGNRELPGRVFKGKKMSGQMGNEKVTVQNLVVFGTDAENGLIFVEGAVPGAKGTYVYLTDAVKKSIPENAPKPTSTSETKIGE